MSDFKQWTKEEFQGHLRVNSDYNSAVVIAALYKKVFGVFPKIGLSGHQGSGAEFLLDQINGLNVEASSGLDNT